MSSKMESLTINFKRLLGDGKRTVQKVSMEVARSLQDSAQVFRIMIFLHSAKDFPSVLKLYGIERLQRVNKKRQRKNKHVLRVRRNR